jgi:hypothetical protein
MTDPGPLFETFNAKKLSSVEVARSFVVPAAFRQIAGVDHCFVIGPRGSGKTTLLRMLHGESLMAWRGKEAVPMRRQIAFSTVFLPADELWASQTTPELAHAAFTVQMLYSFVETAIYRKSSVDNFGNQIHHPVQLDHDMEVSLVEHLVEAWGLRAITPSLNELLHELDITLVRLNRGEISAQSPLLTSDAMSHLAFGIRSFNRVAQQPRHRWALLLDEMELAPPEIHREVRAFVRGGASNLILKVSMSPFDRYAYVYPAGGPVPDHDFQTVYLAGQSRREIHEFTTGLWRETLASRDLEYAPLSQVLGVTQTGRELSQSAVPGELQNFIRRVQSRDADFARWLKTRRFNVESLDDLTYNQRSATIRKILPILLFRESVVSYRRDGRPSRRNRNKSLEPFTGVGAVTSALEGNPRWIKLAFSRMLTHYDPKEKIISRGFQFDALQELANRFESLLRVLPTQRDSSRGMTVARLVDIISSYVHRQNTGPFTPDPQNIFTVGDDIPDDVVDALVLGLYAGAFVQLRSSNSPALLSNFAGQRFRLAYLLAVRDYKEFPLRIGKAVSLARILNDDTTSKRAQAADPPERPDGPAQLDLSF